MNSKIKSLNIQLNLVAQNAAGIEMELQKAWNGVFDDMAILRDAVIKLQSSDEYSLGEYNEIVSWIRFDTSSFKDCQMYFVEYMRDTHCVEVDFKNDTLQISHGDDCIVIQDDTGHDNCVWSGQKVVIQESEYLDEKGKVDEAKRNALIEAYMERTGYFPGVFRLDSYGNVSSINTLAK